MAFDNKNRGSIWKNKRKEKDTHPDFTGSLDVDGVAYWVNAWKRPENAKPEAPAMTFTVRQKEAIRPQEQARPVKSSSRASDDLDDSVPF